MSFLVEIDVARLKLMWRDAWIEENFRRDLALLNFAIARSPRRNG